MQSNNQKTILSPHDPWPLPHPQNNVITPPDDNHQQNQKQHEVLKCPRCDSSNTKFCYYNNYSLSQPRHFCKACKRYWTKGGTLRNVPVGGSCRKNYNKRFKKQPSSINSSNLSSPSSFALPMAPNMMNPNLNTNLPFFQDFISSSCNNPSLLFSSYTNASSSMKGFGENFGTILPSYGYGGGMADKEVIKSEMEGQNGQMDQSNVGMGMMEVNSFAAWLDPSNNLTSFVPSLI